MTPMAVKVPQEFPGHRERQGNRAALESTDNRAGKDHEDQWAMRVGKQTSD